MKKNESLMKKLLNSFAIILIVVVNLFALIVSYAVTARIYSDAQEQVNNLSLKLPTVIEEYENNLRGMALDLFPDQERIQSMQDFFDMDLSNYYSQQLSKEQFLFFPRDIQNLYSRYDNIEGIVIDLNDMGTVYYSTKENKMGKKVNSVPNMSNKLIFDRVITQYESYKPMGNIFLLVDYDRINEIIEQEKTETEASVFFLSPKGRVKYSYNHGNGNLIKQDIKNRYGNESITSINDDGKYIMKEVTLRSGESLVVASLKKSLILSSLNIYGWVFGISLSLNGILLFALFRFFGEYEHQVSDILLSMNKVRDGEIDHRIETSDKEAELSEISLAINETLDSINLYVEQIYLLEIHQQDINLRALQSQINPHFLYNTLEFIRMYAVNEGVDELADIVYTFSTLLRNNISLEKQTTIEHELEFCEKYVYLHQMRYPDRIAYKFEIEEGLNDILLPKFSIQPLIENYFIHGVDYGSVENALSVEVYQKDNRIEIKISDNGQGMSIKAVEKLQEKLDNSVFNISDHKSVGLLNVHERLKVFLRDYDYKMKIINNMQGGITVLIGFKKEAMHV